MSDFTLESPDDPATTIVTGSPGERARLVAQGYRDVTGDTDEPDAPELAGETGDPAQPTASRKADTKTNKTETRDQ
jgi:hypothetical protein